MPESSNLLNSLDPGLRRDDVVSGKHAFMDGHYLVSVNKQHLPSFRRRPESSMSLNFLDPGLRRDDVVSGKHAFLNGYYLGIFSIVTPLVRDLTLFITLNLYYETQILPDFYRDRSCTVVNSCEKNF